VTALTKAHFKLNGRRIGELLFFPNATMGGDD
jgi:hypothetical protein